jgi:hypothetical protein
MGGWMGGCKSRFKDCLQQSKKLKIVALKLLSFFKNERNWVKWKNSWQVVGWVGKTCL